jgi:cellulose synthase/poly-beta-1,6-N-acetylglucosamine synthase-like glycosyltransferase
LPVPTIIAAGALAGSWLQGAFLGLYVAAQALLVLYSSHRYVTLWRWWRRVRGRSHEAPAIPDRWPSVTVQLPIYNERLVVDRLVDSVAALDYPDGLLEIQVLDDSTDETRGRAAAAVARHRARGVDIVRLDRDRREGYKAGALAAGLARARGEIIAVFDADFVPDPDFLHRLVPNFSDPRVGMVQARWGHLNRDRSLLTAAQAVMLDSHFVLEHEVRMRSGLFFNFNGTAGAWRRECIEDAGGWTHDTLTEDLDLSYRAQLRGWRFVFDPTVSSPAELPGHVEALKSQQRRWAKGSIQTARKLLPRVFADPLPLPVKLEAFFHLTNNFAYPLLLALGLLLLPVMVSTRRTSPEVAALLELGVILLGVVPVTLFLAAGQLAGGARGLRVIRDVGAALVLGAGLCVNNTRAVLEGLGSGLGDWERTPKTGEGLPSVRLRHYAPGRGATAGIELALTLYFAALGTVSWRAGHLRSIPFIALLVAGFGTVCVHSLRGRWSSAGGSA